MLLIRLFLIISSTKNSSISGHPQYEKLGVISYLTTLTHLLKRPFRNLCTRQKNTNKTARLERSISPNVTSFQKRAPFDIVFARERKIQNPFSPVSKRQPQSIKLSSNAAAAALARIHGAVIFVLKPAGSLPPQNGRIPWSKRKKQKKMWK